MSSTPKGGERAARSPRSGRTTAGDSASRDQHAATDPQPRARSRGGRSTRETTTLSGAEFAVPPSVADTVRPLLIAGFVVTGNMRQRRHTELLCERVDLLGATVPYLVALFEGRAPEPDDLTDAAAAARRARRLLVAVAGEGGDGWLGWAEFLQVLGGAVPAWRALGPSYASDLVTLADNRLPPGVTGEAWRHFEEAVADGFEFVLGRRVRRLGGVARGRRVSDLLAHTPDDLLLVVDAKATGGEFDASGHNLRALAEYVKTQQRRQSGAIRVAGAVIVAPAFAQDEAGLLTSALDFHADTQVPARFLTAETLTALVAQMAEYPRLRGALRWTRLLARPGLLTADAVRAEVREALGERVDRDADPRAPSPRIARRTGGERTAEGRR